MPSKRQVLDQLKWDELLAAVERFELPVTDRRVRDLLIDALASARRATLAKILGELKRARLKELCRALGLEDGGREKALIIARLAGEEAGPGGGMASEAPRAALDAREPKAVAPPAGRAPKRSAKPAAAGDESNSQLEARLWSAADELQAKSDLVYQHVFDSYFGAGRSIYETAA